METIGKIRRRRLVHGESISAMARDLGLARNTVKRALRFEGEAKWGVPEEIEREALKRMDERLLETYQRFDNLVTRQS